MHVAIAFDEDRLRRERSMLNRVCIGLVAEGIRLTRIIPAGLRNPSFKAGEDHISLIPRHEVATKTVPWNRHYRIRKLSEGFGSDIPDAVYVIGEEMWPIGVELGRHIERPILIDVWSADVGRRAALLRNKPFVEGFVAACDGIADCLARHLDRSIVLTVPMGMTISDEHKSSRQRIRSSTMITVVGQARDLHAYRRFLQGVAPIIHQNGNLDLCLELHGTHDHEIWREAYRLNLLSNVIIVDELPRFPHLLSTTSIMVVPEIYGELRSTMLDAMALGIPTLAASGDGLNMLIDGETGVILENTASDSWRVAIESLLANPQHHRKLGRRGREFVTRYHQSSNHIQRLAAAFHDVVKGGSFSFPLSNAS